MKFIFFSYFLMFSFSVYAQENTATKHSLFLGSLTMHGFDNRNYSWEGMPRKLDDRGRFVINPGLGYQYSSNFNYQTSILKDCYDNWAGTLMIGKDFAEWDYLKLGWYGGLYWREAPYYINRYGNRVKYKDPLPMLERGNIQLIPMGFISLEFLPNQRIKPVIFTNGFLTNISIKIDF